MQFDPSGVLESSFSADVDGSATLPILNFFPERIKVTNNHSYFVAWKLGSKSEIMLIDWSIPSIIQFIEPKPDSSGGFSTFQMHIEFS